ncbi:MAG: ABC transporter ATP-binding protein [Syntrophothermus sp.]
MGSIDISNITKTYGNVTALKDVSLSIEKGELFGFIGPDGAGKTTLFRILTTLLVPDSGTATVEGWDVVKDFRKIRKMVGYMPGRFSLYMDLTVEENLQFYATIFGTTIQENYDLIKDIYQQIEPFKKRKAGNLSGGMKQKLALSCALIHKPVVLFLDEPTTGVDAVSRVEFWEMLRRLREGGITILVSTPYMDEAKLCNRIALIQDGEIMAIDTPDAITAMFPYDLYLVRADRQHSLIGDLREIHGVRSANAFGQTVHVSVEKGKDPSREITSFLENKGYKGIRIEKTNADIEDCFIQLMTEK